MHRTATEWNSPSFNFGIRKIQNLESGKFKIWIQPNFDSLVKNIQKISSLTPCRVTSSPRGAVFTSQFRVFILHWSHFSTNEPASQIAAVLPKRCPLVARKLERTLYKVLHYVVTLLPNQDIGKKTGFPERVLHIMLQFFNISSCFIIEPSSLLWYALLWTELGAHVQIWILPNSKSGFSQILILESKNIIQRLVG